MKLLYESLIPSDRILLDNSCNLIFEISPPKPHIYITVGVPSVRLENSARKALEPRKDPKEILADPRGVSASVVRAVYIPDSVWESPVFKVALTKLDEMGISPDRVRNISDLEHTTAPDYRMMRYGNIIRWI